jgi:hypothetical protein
MLTGCAEQQAQQAWQAQQAMVAAAGQQFKADSDACTTTFSEKDSDAIARAKCINNAEEKEIRFVGSPDLHNLRMAKRIELAEKQAAHKITRAELMLQLSHVWGYVDYEDGFDRMTQINFCHRYNWANLTSASLEKDCGSRPSLRAGGAS